MFRKILLFLGYHESQKYRDNPNIFNQYDHDIEKFLNNDDFKKINILLENNCYDENTTAKILRYLLQNQQYSNTVNWKNLLENPIKTEESKSYIFSLNKNFIKEGKYDLVNQTIERTKLSQEQLNKLLFIASASQKKDSPQIINLLIKFGANSDAVDEHGFTPRHYAELSKNGVNREILLNSESNYFINQIQYYGRDFYETIIDFFETNPLTHDIKNNFICTDRFKWFIGIPNFSLVYASTKWFTYMLYRNQPRSNSENDPFGKEFFLQNFFSGVVKYISTPVNIFLTAKIYSIIETNFCNDEMIEVKDLNNFDQVKRFMKKHHGEYYIASDACQEFYHTQIKKFDHLESDWLLCKTVTLPYDFYLYG